MGKTAVERVQYIILLLGNNEQRFFSTIEIPCIGTQYFRAIQALSGKMLPLSLAALLVQMTNQRCQMVHMEVDEGLVHRDTMDALTSRRHGWEQVAECIRQKRTV